MVFSERVATLGWLRDNLKKDLRLKDDQIRIMHGGLTDVEQQEIVESFKQSSSPIRVLITGDVASEGVNLHSQCHELIHFDIPWSLIRIEQRNGRIDRYGQRHRPQITTLLLSPTNHKFSGDVRVLQRLLEREHEAHTQLGDSASLMGKYDAGAEEETIKKALAAGVGPDEVVPTVEQALTAGDSIGALLARLAMGDTSEPAAPTQSLVNAHAGSGLFPTATAFLRQALEEVFETPAASPAKNGVDWREHTAHGTIDLTPPRDLAQRLAVLPKSYLDFRHVKKHLVLAATGQRARAELKEAIDDPSSKTLWPEAHFLGPLHPVLEWASDRALGKLGRNEVFAIRGEVQFPTVLLVGTLTNRRGQVVAASYMTVAVPDPANATFALVTPHASAREAIENAGVTASAVNPGPVPISEELQNIIPIAVEHAASALAELAGTAAADVEMRVDRWATRVDDWQQTAAGMTQIAGLKARRTTVEQEKQIAESMMPDQRLVRALLVILPDENGED